MVEGRHALKFSSLYLILMKACDYIALYLESRGVSHVFELVGGMITFLLDSLKQETKISIVSMHHEQGAGFAAEGYGRMSGIPGIAMATSGPGATNLLTAIGSCYFDSVPTVFITGQVNRHEQKGDKNIRQLGFQETDIVSMARPVTKAAILVNDPADLPRLLAEAFELAVSGRPGPVLLDVPMDVQRAEITDLSLLANPVMEMPLPHSPEEDVFLTILAADLARSQRPLVLVGGGVNSGRAVAQFRRMIETLGVPVVNSLMAVDILPSGHPLRVGMIGSYGNRWANIALSECDLLLVIGSRLDVRQTGADTVDFKGSRVIHHIDCEPGEMNNRVLGCQTLRSEIRPFCESAAVSLAPVLRPDWMQRIQSLQDEWPDTAELADVEGINPNCFLHQLSSKSGDAAAFVADVGQHQMWAAQSLDLHANQRFLTSGGMGAMGFALPCAIGACLQSSKPVVVVAGDGGFQLNIQELQTVARNRLPLKMVVINNQCHGMVRQFQDSYFKGRVQSTVWGYSAPSFCSVAMAYGIEASEVANPEAVESAIERMWQDPSEPFLLEVHVALTANAYPKMAFGRPISEMEPFAQPLDMEGT
jgi:acetolactate synthase-1/2/3 large subunit